MNPKSDRLLENEAVQDQHDGQHAQCQRAADDPAGAAGRAARRSLPAVLADEARVFDRPLVDQLVLGMTPLKITVSIGNFSGRSGR
jgi:hypothetical protein